MVLEIEARAEGAAGAGEHDDPAIVVVGDVIESRLELEAQIDRHGIEALRPVEADHGDMRPRLFEGDVWHVLLRE